MYIIYHIFIYIHYFCSAKSTGDPNHSTLPIEDNHESKIMPFKGTPAMPPQEVRP